MKSQFDKRRINAMPTNRINLRRKQIYRQIRELIEELQNLNYELSEKQKREENYITIESAEEIAELLEHLDEEAHNIHSAQREILEFFLLSGRQRTPLVCQLPHHLNPPHYFYSGYICQKNPKHVFCKKHSLTNCVICGGALK
jgi:hypothetical protein